MKKDVSALDNVYFKEGDGHKMTDFTDGLEGAKDVGSQGPVDNKRKSNERRPPLLFAKRRSRPPVGESPLLRTDRAVVIPLELFLPPVGESPLLSIPFVDTDDNTISNAVYSTLRRSASPGAK